MSFRHCFNSFGAGSSVCLNNVSQTTNDQCSTTMRTHRPKNYDMHAATTVARISNGLCRSKYRSLCWIIGDRFSAQMFVYSVSYADRDSRRPECELFSFSLFCVLLCLTKVDFDWSQWRKDKPYANLGAILVGIQLVRKQITAFQKVSSFCSICEIRCKRFVRRLPMRLRAGH
jgi:hypothetical protein